MLLVTAATYQTNYNQIWINVINHLFKYASIESNLYIIHWEASGDYLGGRTKLQRKKKKRTTKEKRATKATFLHVTCPHMQHIAAKLHIYFCRFSEVLKIFLLSKLNLSTLLVNYSAEPSSSEDLPSWQYILIPKLKITLGKNPGTLL